MKAWKMKEPSPTKVGEGSLAVATVKNEIEPEHSDVFEFNHVGCGGGGHTPDTPFVDCCMFRLVIGVVIK